PAALWLAAMVPVAFLALFRQSLRVPHADLSMVPLAATAAMLLTILLNARVGIVVGFLVSSLCALMAHADISLFLVTALSAWIGVLSVADISSRGQLMVRAPIVLALANGILAASWGTLRDAPSDEILSIAFWGGLAGIFSVVATAALAMSLERPFGITTHLRLLELLAPDELVMRRMQAEAPGTYTHSLMVASLSEAAAKAVGADPLLCRVSGLYHDIGKLRRPHCFVENQSGENIHDKLSPQLSALIILAHVKDGIELGRALRVPQPVIDIIAQHHGTTLISYFYQRALAQCGAKNCDRDDNGVSSPSNATVSANSLPSEASFRYAGPRPQTKEAAIVLLADTIEASARSLPNLTQERLESHIKTMIDQRLQEGELSECELTLRDLGIIESSFIHVLRGVLHQRIAYPEPGTDFGVEDKEDERGWMRDTLAASNNKPGQPGFKDRREAPRSDRRRKNHDAEPRRRDKNKQGQKGKPAFKVEADTQPEHINGQPNATVVAEGASQRHNNARQDYNGRSGQQLKEAYDRTAEAASDSTVQTAPPPNNSSQDNPEISSQSQGECNLDTNGTGFAIGNGESDHHTNGHTTHSANGHSTNGHATNGHANGRLRSQHTNGRDSHHNGSHQPTEAEFITESTPERSRA
ncbi:MAG: HDIG domain-containing protein, partial [Abitibacteriaceae bacterium]|nr:HDIG domain-containing protein [Abditibacteriaceae bacterium]